MFQPRDIEVGIKDYGSGPPINVLELTDGSTIEGLVIEVNTPWLFWFQPENPELDKLQADMQYVHCTQYPWMKTSVSHQLHQAAFLIFYKLSV